MEVGVNGNGTNLSVDVILAVTKPIVQIICTILAVLTQFPFAWSQFSNRRSGVEPHWSNRVSDFVECLSICRKQSFCWAVSFNKRTNRCDLLADVDIKVIDSDVVNGEYDTYVLN